MYNYHQVIAEYKRICREELEEDIMAIKDVISYMIEVLDKNKVLQKDKVDILRDSLNKILEN